MSETLTALAQTEDRSMAYAIQSGQAIGGLRNVRSFLESARAYPEMRDYYLARMTAYVGGLLADIDPEGDQDAQATAAP